MKLKLSHTSFRMWQTRLDVTGEPEGSFLGGQRIMPQAILPAVVEGAHRAAQSLSPTSSKTRQLPAAARQTSPRHIFKGMRL